MADTHQMHETIAIVISQVMGGSSSSSSAPAADPRTAPKTANELEAKLTRVLG